ncbi:hypothetical protein [Fodinicola acaciae]|uniref:hypothetical protein n=1 Tax=Fodinicola acaciae TaxID=2681555 RepID=UPI003CCDDBE2
MGIVLNQPRALDYLGDRLDRYDFAHEELGITFDIAKRMHQRRACRHRHGCLGTAASRRGSSSGSAHPAGRGGLHRHSQLPCRKRHARCPRPTRRSSRCACPASSPAAFTRPDPTLPPNPGRLPRHTRRCIPDEPQGKPRRKTRRNCQSRVVSTSGTTGRTAIDGAASGAPARP